MTLKVPTMKPRPKMPMPCNAEDMRGHLIAHHGYACVSRRHTFPELMELHERAHGPHEFANHSH